MKARYPEMQLQVQLCNPQIGLAGTLDIRVVLARLNRYGATKTGRETIVSVGFRQLNVTSVP